MSDLATTELAVEKGQTAARGPDGRFPSAVTGAESDEELRQLVIELTWNSLASQTPLHGPFQMLNGLSHDSLHGLVAGMNRSALLYLFALDCECRNQPPEDK